MKIFKHIQLYTVSIQRISTIFIDQMQTHLFSKISILCWHQIFNSSPCGLIILKDKKAKFKVSLGKYLNTHSFYTVDDCFVLGCSVILFCIMFIVFYSIKIMYICVFMTCSTPYCPCGTLMDPWNVHVCVCACVCTYAYTYACMYVYVCTHLVHSTTVCHHIHHEDSSLLGRYTVSSGKQLHTFRRTIVCLTSWSGSTYECLLQLLNLKSERHHASPKRR